MAYRKKSWNEKLKDRTGYPKILKLERGFPCYNALHKMGLDVGDDVVIVNHSEVVELMRKVPEGKVTTIIDICRELGRRHEVKAGCTLVGGISVSTAANAVEEARSEGRDLDIPYWRTLKADGMLNEKFPGGERRHKELLEREGHKVSKRGAHYVLDGLGTSRFDWPA